LGADEIVARTAFQPAQKLATWRLFLCKAYVLLSIRARVGRRYSRRPARAGRDGKDVDMAQYAILIYEDEAFWPDAGQEAFDRTLKEHAAFAEEHAGALRGGSALHPTATSVRKDPSGGFAVTDGAFAETKEALNGYYVIEAADLDEAVAVAKRVPARSGGVEVRPVMVFD